MARPDTKVKDIIDGLNNIATQVIRKLALDIVANLVKAAAEGGTPVDTGWARSNWLINIGSPITSPSGDVGQPSPSAQSAGQASMLVYSVLQGPVWISNNVPYIVFLNEGSSKQAPAGFVQRSIARALTSLPTTVGGA